VGDAAGPPAWRVLGPVRLVTGGAEVGLGPAKQCCVLAVLLMSPGWSVPIGTLIDRVWGENPPRSATPVAPYATRLRKAIDGTGAGRLRYTTGGYLLDCDPEQVDLHRGRRLAAQAGDDPARYEAALRLWTPEPLAGIPGEWAARTRAALAAEGLDLLARWAEAELRAGRPAVVADRLRPRLAEHPTAEGAAAALMLALARSGRPAEALDCYARLRKALAQELGTEPSRRIADLQLRILRADDLTEADRTAGAHRATTTGRTVDTTAPSRPKPGPPVPALLPGDVALTGRDAELAVLDALLDDSGLIAVSGTPGVGKTALAVHWAHRVAHRFPDGVLYVNLRGFDPGGQATEPAEAVRGFLDALGLPVADTPPTRDAQVARYRGMIAGRRVLVLLDNARDADQVRLLLPGTPTAAVVVTSRSQLTPLIAADGARPVRLDVLTPAGARDLLARRLGPDRAAEPAAAEVVDRCARLPLALTVAAARAAQTGFPLAALAAELAEARQRLDTLDAGDARTDVRAVFSWSYTALSAPAARLFRLLGAHPGPDISATAAVSLAGGPVRPELAELARASLVTEHVRGRYVFHDLLRAYAAELAGEAESQAATVRVVDHYTRTAYAAERVLEPHSDPVRVPVPPPVDGVTPEPVDGHDAALAWLAAEHPVLVAVHRVAAGLEPYRWLLAWSLSTYRDRRGLWPEQATAWRLALDAARRLGDGAAEAYTHTFLGRAEAMLGNPEEAAAHLRQALELYGAAGDAAGAARARGVLAHQAARDGDLPVAMEHLGWALELFGAIGHRRGRASALNNLGWCHAMRGEHAAALARCAEGLALFEEIGDRLGQADTADSLGYVHLQLGEHAAATARYRQAAALSRALGDLYKEADALTNLAEAQAAGGDPDGARESWRRALVLLTELGHERAAAVREKLHAADGPVAHHPNGR
jgi:DNA-binding SARP family transcriptional activator/tetratricopeptide (TPR) repeat protein